MPCSTQTCFLQSAAYFIVFIPTQSKLSRLVTEYFPFPWRKYARYTPDRVKVLWALIDLRLNTGIAPTQSFACTDITNLSPQE